MPEVFGFLNIDKPLGMTSHDVVAKVRRGLKVRKVGHAGTLDPLADGVLVVCLGHATRLSDYVMHGAKLYRAVVHLGVETETYDAEGAVTARRDAAHITRETIKAVLPQFTGEIAQVPPMYSAIKQGGRKLYELARAGETVERPPRDIVIHSLTIEDWSPPQVTLDVICGAGTYIRSLAHDIGVALDVGAHLAALTRTASGTFRRDDAVKLDTLLDDPEWQKAVVSPDDALADMLLVSLDAGDAANLVHGRILQKACDAPDEAIARAHDPDGQFLGLVRAANGIWRPHKVFLPSP